jgi:hypothetical protein
MNTFDFWNKVGLLLFIIGAMGIFTRDKSENILWIYPIIWAIGMVLYLIPEQYYAKIKKR